ncbi:MAG: caspase family protein [Spirochaetaceae bacterium]|jgi:hypothetical protein|nr:caspase family protein [Spirochaetaceae bacterium]
MKKSMTVLVITLFMFSLGTLLFAATPTKRFGLFIGSNNGGAGRVTLRYAVRDAQSVSDVFSSMGGVEAGNNLLLVEPTVSAINRRLNELQAQTDSARAQNERTELVFYYSGHSDEEGLLLGREQYSYKALREKINAVKADMQIVILDSCASGAITRAKGGVKAQPFLFDTSASPEGYAYLTSSSEDESSQESDAIGSSYFTHSILTGLRGAADSAALNASGDGRVTLNELYRFAYDETLLKTETSSFGAQHPSFDIQISGSGDVVLTDLNRMSSGLLFDGDVTGRISIRDASDFLVAELSKAGNKSLELGLDAGSYRVLLRQDNYTYEASINLTEDETGELALADFIRVASDNTDDRLRGEGWHPHKKIDWKNFFSIGIGGSFSYDWTHYNLQVRNRAQNINTKTSGLFNTDMLYGGYVFFDTPYSGLNIGFNAINIPGTKAMFEHAGLSGDRNGFVLSLVAYGKWPFKINDTLTLYPIAGGGGYFGKDGQNNLLACGWGQLGAGADISLGEKLFIRVEALYKAGSNGGNVGGDDAVEDYYETLYRPSGSPGFGYDDDYYETEVKFLALSHGPEVRLGIGFKF